jgi:hypothetical protein
MKQNRMKKLFFTAILFISSITLQAQIYEAPNVKVPEIIPASPEASAISKGAQLSVGMHTGSANSSVPIFDIQMGRFSLPISLNYASNGLKIDEVPSRVGLGWSLSAGGVVSRMVNGNPDDESTQLAIPANLNAYTNELLSFFNQLATMEDKDAQPDEFRISIGNVNGKFIRDRTGYIMQIPHSDLKISVSKSGGKYQEIVVRAPDGILYRFGGTGAIENTISHNVSGGGHQSVRTAFFIKKIEYPDGESVTFNYTPISTTVKTGIVESATRSINTDFCPNTADAAVKCTANEYESTTKYTQISYSTVYLSSIQSSTGILVNFFYADRPDNSGDNRLTNITVSNQSFIVKQVALGYEDDGDVLELNRRFFLKKVSFFAPTAETTTDSLHYSFDYNPGGSGRLSRAMDHFGFDNGAGNATLLTAPEGETSTWPYANANRNPNWQYAKATMLNRVNYPTGGYDAFEYEANTKTYTYQVNTFVGNTSVSGQGGSISNPPTYSSDVVYIKRNHTGKLIASSFLSPGYSGPPIGDNSMEKTLRYQLKNLTTNVVEINRVQLGFQSVVMEADLKKDNAYQMIVTVRGGSMNAGAITLLYDTSATDIYATVNAEAGGVRVKAIHSFDPLTQKTNHKYYKYEALSKPGLSSGVGVTRGDYASLSEVQKTCPTSFSQIICRFKVLNSNSVSSLYLYDNVHIGYTHVIESDDAAFANGGIEHIYAVQYASSGGAVAWGSRIPGLPANTYPTLNGTETGTFVFDKNKKILKSTRQHYSFDNRTDYAIMALAVRKKYQSVYNNNPPRDEDFAPYDVEQYSYTSSWIHLDSTVNKEYNSNDSLLSKVVYYYANAANTQPSRIETTGSNGELLAVEKAYPNTLTTTVGATASDALAKMANANIIAPVVEEKNYRNNTLIGMVRTDYKDWFANSKVLMPELTLTQKGSAAAETRLHYYAYDTDGNPLEVSKEQDVHIAYIRDYNNRYPVAEIKNAGISDGIACTSFEADGKGYWQFTGTPVADNTAPTGSMAYNLANGSISRTGLNTATNYMITYWSKTGSATISGSTLRNLESKNGWTLYEHRISGISIITISGGVLIDELRLYPAGALVTTYTYIPLIGTTSVASPNNTIVRYEYDHFNRLKTVRDGDRNILKQYEYKYGQAIIPCANTSSNWQVTGLLRCAKNSNNNNTGVEEREEIDNNNCSPTYRQKRWTAIGVTGNCVPVANCTGENKRVVNGVCETGVKIILYTTQIGGGQWECCYYYTWTDGYRSQNFITINTAPCYSETTGLDD